MSSKGVAPLGGATPAFIFIYNIYNTLFRYLACQLFLIRP